MVYAVLDSGIFIAQTFPEQYSLEAIALLNHLEAQQANLVAPHLIHYEIVSVIRKMVYTGRIMPQNAIQARDKLLNYNITVYFDQLLLKRAYDLSTEINRVRAYDTQFLALAERFNCDFWTTDEKFYNVAYSRYPIVRWIGNYPII